MANGESLWHHTTVDLVTDVGICSYFSGTSDSLRCEVIILASADNTSTSQRHMKFVMLTVADGERSTHA